MWLAAGRVIQTRVGMGVLFPHPTSADSRREAERMVTEKWMAASDAATAASLALSRAYMGAGMAAWRSALEPDARAAPAGKITRSLIARSMRAAPGVWSAALAPVARRVHANDRRLHRRRS